MGPEVKKILGACPRESAAQIVRVENNCRKIDVAFNTFFCRE